MTQLHADPFILMKRVIPWALRCDATLLLEGRPNHASIVLKLEHTSLDKTEGSVAVRIDRDQAHNLAAQLLLVARDQADIESGADVFEPRR